MDLYMLSALVFIAVLFLIFYKDRKNVERESILLMRRTQKGKRGIIKLGIMFPRFWKVLGGIGVVIGFIMSFYIVYLLLDLIVTNFMVGKIGMGLSLVLPSPGADAAVVPGVILVPFWYWIISLALLVLVHEGMHGIMAAREKIRIKSMGWGLFAVIPLAFVEPDEDQLQKKPAWPQLRVFAGGSFANFLLAGLCLVIIASMAGLFASSGVAYSALIEDYPSDNANLTGIIVGIDEYEIRELNDLKDALAEIGENKTITITTGVEDGTRDFVVVTQGEPRLNFKPSLTFVILSLIEHPIPGTIDFFMGTADPDSWTQTANAVSMWEWTGQAFPGLDQRAADRTSSLESQQDDFKRPGYIGIAGVSSYVHLKAGLEGYTEPVIFIQGLLFWMFVINLGVGAFNLLPISILDGGRMWAILFQKVSKKRWKGIMKVISRITIIIVIFLMALSFSSLFGF